MATGVSVLKGKEEVHVLAPIVVSNAGIFNTYQKLLPKELQAKPGEEDGKGLSVCMCVCVCVCACVMVVVGGVVVYTSGPGTK